jgi:hypothetical protein
VVGTLELPAFRAFADQIGERTAEAMNREARRSPNFREALPQAANRRT